MRRIRNEMIDAGIPVEFSKGEGRTRAARGEHLITYDEALETADRHSGLQERHQGDRRPGGRAATFMAKWSMEDVACRATCTPACGTARAATPSWPTSRTEAGCRRSAGAFPGRTAPHGAPAGLAGRTDGRPPPGSYTPGSWAPRRWCGRGQPHLRFPGGRPRAGRRVESRRSGGGREPATSSVLAASLAAGIYGIDHELEPGDLPTNAYEATRTLIPSTLIESIEEPRSSDVALEPRPRCTTTCSTRRCRSGRPSTPRHDRSKPGT